MSYRTNNLIYFLLLISMKCLLCDEHVKVGLKQGILLGKVEKTFLKQQNYYSFKGVPYAEPPVGKLRFQPPIAHERWEEAYEAYQNKPTCLQFCSRMRSGEPFGISGSEDCLYLSVFTPSLKGKKPVVVFDYNDNFRTGFNGTDTYSPEFFMEEDVIVVTLSHRLGLLGYLTTEDEIIPGNFGIRDFILGLEWVKNNIENFGGDPNQVTLMGTRGGAAMINILLYTEKAKNLFSAVIMQSGTAFEPIYFYENPSRKAFQFGELLDIKTEDSTTLLEELQKVESETLLLNEIKVIDQEGIKKYQMTVYPFAPTIETDSENAVLTFLPEKGKIVNDVPILIGFNSRNGLDLVSLFIEEPKLLKDLDLSRAMHFPLRPNFRFDINSTIFQEAVDEITKFYFEDGYLHSHNILEYAVNTGDALQNYAIDYATKKIANDLESPVFYYMFDFRGALNENSEYMMKYARFSLKNWGATVADELCYLHLCTRIKKNYENLLKLVTEQAELKVLKKMVYLWTNFAKTRNPTPVKGDKIVNGITWEPVEKASNDTKYLHITKTLKMKVNPLGERAKFWDQFLEKYSKMAVDGVVTDDKPRDEL